VDYITNLQINLFIAKQNLNVMLDILEDKTNIITILNILFTIFNIAKLE
jgi:hypothetical protein